MRKKKSPGEDRDLSITYGRINVVLAKKNNNLTTLLHKFIRRQTCAPKGSSPALFALITLYYLELYWFECSTCSVSCGARSCRTVLFCWLHY